jgi:two-component sensor histidine kinase
MNQVTAGEQAEADTAGPGQAAATKRAGPARTLRSRLVMLVLSLLAPALLLTILLLLYLAEQTYSAQERQLSAQARTLALVADGELKAQAATLQALSVSQLLMRGDWRGFDGQARKALDGTTSWVVVRDNTGRHLVNTWLPLGAPLPFTPDAATGMTWSGQRWGARVSNVVWGRTPGIYAVVTSRPIRMDDGRQARLSVVTPTAAYSDLLRRQALPPRWTAVILDGRRHVVGRNRNGEAFVDRPASADMRAAMAARPRGVIRSRTLDGIPTISAFDQLPGSNWAVIVAMPRNEPMLAARRTLLIGLGLGGLLLAMGVLLALRLARRIARPVVSLSRAAEAWVEGRPASFPTETGLPETDSLSRAMAAAMAQVREHDSRQRLLINELNHRVKNTLATVQAVAQHTRRGAADVDSFYTALEGRVIAMSRAHELLTRSDWEGAELGELARQTLKPFEGPRLVITGAPAQVAPTDALNLALVLFELATNAAKHGALSAAGGQVELSWSRVDGLVQVRWVERGGPPVSPPSRPGFGSRLIARAVHDLQPSRYDLDPAGVRCELTLKAAPTSPRTASQGGWLR